jgi:DNA (cytosine-5)-methyltransferase 1
MNWYTKRRRAQHDQDFETWIRGGVCPTLNAFDNTGDSRATVLIIDGTRVDDVRVYEGPVQTLKERMGTGGNNVPVIATAIPIQGTIIGRQDHNGPQGKGFGDETDPMYTLDSVSQHGVATDMQVRRLTPVECERLMGWPDNHTLPRADGKDNPDTTRYKMCGNGVASPVAQWIGQHLMEIMSGP